MKFVCVFAILIFLSSAVASQEEVEPEEISLPTKINFTVKPSAWKMSGETEYELNVSTPVILLSGDTVDFAIRSLLEFPLDVKMAGGTIGIFKSNTEKTIWALELSLFKNLGDPGVTMKDHDWFSVPTIFDGKVSYTESKAKMKMTIFEIEGTAHIFSLGQTSISILGGYSYQKIEQELIGLDGWYLDSNLTQQPQSSTGPAINYWITYKRPKVGISIQRKFSSKVSLNLKSAFVVVWANDFDDHLLRGFHLFADGTGTGRHFSGNIRWNLNDQISGSHPFLEFHTNYEKLLVVTTETRVQYADFGPNENPVGTSSGGLPHVIRSDQFWFGVSLGLIF